MFDLQRPEISTLVRWALRVALVAFLAWLVRGRADEQEADGGHGPARRTGGAKSRTAPARPALRPRQDPYPASLRQRRQAQASETGEIEEVVDVAAKPKEMWEVHEDGSAPQILKPDDTDAGGTKAKLVVGSCSTTAREAKGRDTLHGHERPVTFVTWNREGNLLFTCSKDKLVCVWSCPEGDCLGRYEGHTGAVWACSISADSRWLVTCGADLLVLVWEARTARELARLELPGVVRFVEWAAGGNSPSPVSDRFVTCHNRFGAHPPAITVWRFNGKAVDELCRIVNMPTPVTQVRWGRGDYFVASAHTNGELIFWRADTGAEVRRLKAHESGISKFDFSSDRELVATVSHDKALKLWDVGKNTEWRLLYSVRTDRPLNAVALGPVTRAAAAGPAQQRPASCCVIAAGGQDVRDVAATSSATDQFGALLFSLGKAETLPCRLQAKGALKGHFGPVHTLAFARDSSTIASGSEDGCVRLHFLDCSASAPTAQTDPRSRG